MVAGLNAMSLSLIGPAAPRNQPTSTLNSAGSSLNSAAPCMFRAAVRENGGFTVRLSCYEKPFPVVALLCRHFLGFRAYGGLPRASLILRFALGW